MAEAAVFDKQGAMDRVDSDKDLLVELVGIFFGDYDSALTRLRNSANSENPTEIVSAAHFIKSALGNIGAMRAFELARTMELAAKGGDVSKAKENCAQLEKEVSAFKVEFEAFSKA